MKRTLHPLVSTRTIFSRAIAALLLFSATGPAHAAIKTWTGGSIINSRWSDNNNWLGGLLPGAGDQVNFTGTTRVSNTNDLPSLSVAQLSFVSPADAFTLNSVFTANAITLASVTDNQPVLTETINMPVTLSLNGVVTVSAGTVAFNKPITGSGLSLTLTGGGEVDLNGTNAFTGGLVINGGTTAKTFTDGNLGGVPGSATPGNVVINSGILRVTNSYTMNANRGIALGATSGTVTNNIITVDPAVTLTYNGIMANNGAGVGGLQKFGFGGLTLGKTNLYTGPTAVENGTLTLNFTQAGTPTNNLIQPVSSLQLGGANSGAGGTNYAQLTINPAQKTNTFQTFASTLVTFGGSVIQVLSNSTSTNILNLGALTHQPGGTLVLVTPPLAGIKGNITTTSGNVNGILGGFATLSSGVNEFGIVYGTNFASVDANGNIIPFTAYTNAASPGGFLHANYNNPTNNLLIDNTAGDVVVDSDLSGTTTDVNTINVTKSTGFTIQPGVNNTLRLGRVGAIFKSDNTGGITWAIGQSTGGGNGVQGVGTLTAGGAPNTPGELIFNINSSSETSGSLNVEVTITDNGTGPVTVVKNGASSMKLRGHNTFSGGSYVLQGRYQEAGSEIGTANPDAFGTGPIFCLPGCYIFPSGAAGKITNALFIAGTGTSAEPLGATRGGDWAGPITLIGDTVLGGGATLDGAITGPFGVTFGSQNIVNGGANINNPGNNYTGPTIMTARNNTGANVIVNGTNDVIPDGFGFGNVQLVGFSTGTVEWDLHGFNETINGLSTSGTGSSCFIDNAVAGSNSVLTVGNNNQSGTFGGTLRDSAGSGGTLALIKIGGGIETLSGTNTYSGGTTVNGGTLALSGSGNVANAVTVQSNATLDISGLTVKLTAPSSLNFTNGTLAANNAQANVPVITLNNSGLSLILNPSSNNITAGTVNFAGTTNVVNIVGVTGVTGYPTPFPVLTYGTLNGPINLGIGATPNAITGGFISNDVTDKIIYLVLTNGPSPVTWTGTDPLGNTTFWDLDASTNWLAFKGFPSQHTSGYDNGDTVQFDDTGSQNIVSLRQTDMSPISVLVSNNVLNYTFTGSGNLTGAGGLVKQGSASATFINTGVDTYRGSVSVQGGTLVFGSDNLISGATTIASGTTLQIGTNGGSGTLPTGNADMEGALIFNRGADLTVNSVISGGSAGALSKLDANNLTLAGANTFTGTVTVASGTLLTASGSALGATNNGTTINSGATLDVDGQNLGFEPIFVRGAGVGGNGAIVNSGAGQNNALRDVHMQGDTTFGGAGRWDIRETGANLANVQLTTGGQPYNLTKVSTNQVTFVGAVVDSQLNNITINGGLLGFETDVSGMGNQTATLTVASGAGLEMFNTVNKLTKNMVFTGNGTSNSIQVGSGTANAIGGPMSITGTNVWSVAAGASLRVDNAITGAGSVLVTGGGSVQITANDGAVAYTGSTIVNPSTQLQLSADNTSTGGTLTNAGIVITGNNQTYSGPVINNGLIAPGGTNLSAGTFNVGSLTLNTSNTVAFDIGSSSDLINVQTNLTIFTNTTFAITPQINHVNVGEIPLINYAVSGTGTETGSTNLVSVTTPLPGYTFALTNDPTAKSIELNVLHVPAQLTWTGANATNHNLWDLAVTTNFVNQSSQPSAFSTGDSVLFTDGATSYQVTVGTNGPANGSLTPVLVQFQNGVANPYTLSGKGYLTGPMQLQVSFGGTAIIANGGNSNNFTGGVIIQNGTLQLGNNDTNGTIGTGGITNFSTIQFNRTDTNILSNFYAGTSGGGFINQIGSGLTAFIGNLTNMYGNIDITHGTLRLGSTVANSPTNLANIFVATGGALDISNSVNLVNVRITAAGTGPTGGGAIVNNGGNSAFTQANFAYVTATNDLTIGGTGRLDWRDATGTNTQADFQTGGNPYNLFKVGTNQLQLTGVQFDNAVGNITVEGGNFGIQGLISPSLGDNTKSLIIWSNATVSIVNMSNALTKPIIMMGGTNAAILNNNTGSNFIASTITLQSGSNQFNIASTWLEVDGLVTGPGAFARAGGSSPLLLNGGATWTGPTYLTAGTTFLTNSTVLTTSPSITFGGGGLDEMGSTAAQSLTIGSGQSVSVTASSTNNGAFIMTGSAQLTIGFTNNAGGFSGSGTFTVQSNNATLAGSTIIGIAKAPSKSNGQLKTTGTGSITYGGTLLVTNVGFTNVSGSLKGGEAFQLFNSGSSNYLGSFSSVTLPPLGPGLSWSNSLAIDGKITVIGTLTPPTITSTTFPSGTQLVIGGSGGTANGTYVLLSATNISQPLVLWVRVSTNTFSGTGTFSVTNNNQTNFQKYFTILQ